MKNKLATLIIFVFLVGVVFAAEEPKVGLVGVSSGWERFLSSFSSMSTVDSNLDKPSNFGSCSYNGVFKIFNTGSQNVYQLGDWCDSNSLVELYSCDNNDAACGVTTFDGEAYKISGSNPQFSGLLTNHNYKYKCYTCQVSQEQGEDVPPSDFYYYCGTDGHIKSTSTDPTYQVDFQCANNQCKSDGTSTHEGITMHDSYYYRIAYEDGPFSETRLRISLCNTGDRNYYDYYCYNGLVTASHSDLLFNCPSGCKNSGTTTLNGVTFNNKFTWDSALQQNDVSSRVCANFQFRFTCSNGHVTSNFDDTGFYCGSGTCRVPSYTTSQRLEGNAVKPIMCVAGEGDQGRYGEGSDQGDSEGDDKTIGDNLIPVGGSCAGNFINGKQCADGSECRYITGSGFICAEKNKPSPITPPNPGSKNGTVTPGGNCAGNFLNGRKCIEGTVCKFQVGSGFTCVDDGINGTKPTCLGDGQVFKGAKGYVILGAYKWDTDENIVCCEGLNPKDLGKTTDFGIIGLFSDEIHDYRCEKSGFDKFMDSIKGSLPDALKPYAVLIVIGVALLAVALIFSGGKK